MWERLLRESERQLRQLFAIAREAAPSVIFFDEIDAGIGGETALFIGKALLKVAQHSQVIAITHLPQIANFANKLIHVSKISEKDPSSSVRTISHIQEITGKEKVEYIQAMNPLH